MKKIVAILLAVMMVFALAVSAGATVDMQAGDWILETSDGSDWFIYDYVGTDTDVTALTSYGGITLTYLGSHTFADNSSLQSFTAPAPIERIGDYAFLNATALADVHLAETVDTIGAGAFSGTTSLRSVDLSSTKVTVIREYMFLNSGVEEAVLPETCTRIANNAFAQCSNLVKVIIPASVTQIDDEAFRASENVVINAPHDSYAIEYAKAKGIAYTYSDITEITFIRGDADGDGDVNIMDATKIQRVLALYDKDTDGMITLRAKLGNEPKLSIMDATRIQRKIAKYDDPYGIGESVTVRILSDGTIEYPAEEA